MMILKSSYLDFIDEMIGSFYKKTDRYKFDSSGF